jgi:general secretion pathway protein H
MMRSRAKGRLAANRGVILLDMILALAIAGLLAAVALPGLSMRLSRSGFDAEVNRAASFLKSARVRALAAAVPMDVEIDVQGRKLRTRWAMHDLDRRILLVWTASDQCPLGSYGRNLRFLPDGRSCAGTLTLRAGSRQADIRIEWFTGRVEAVAL